MITALRPPYRNKERDTGCEPQFVYAIDINADSTVLWADLFLVEHSAECVLVLCGIAVICGEC
jgi:hypothetical protein